MPSLISSNHWILFTEDRHLESSKDHNRAKINPSVAILIYKAYLGPVTESDIKIFYGALTQHFKLNTKGLKAMGRPGAIENDNVTARRKRKRVAEEDRAPMHPFPPQARPPTWVSRLAAVPRQICWVTLSWKTFPPPINSRIADSLGSAM